MFITISVYPDAGLNPCEIIAGSLDVKNFVALISTSVYSYRYLDTLLIIRSWGVPVHIHYSVCDIL